MNGFPWISFLTFTPLLGGLMIIGMSAQRSKLARGLALMFSMLALALAVLIWANFDSTSTELQFVNRYPWVPSLGIEYFVGADGLGLLMILLSAIIVPMAMLASWQKEENTPLYYALILFLQSGLFGTFTALNFFHWFIFWELSLIPAFFLIKLWGGPQRTAAATQFFLYTMVGSIALLLSFLAIYQAVATFDFIRLSELGRTGELASAFSAKLGWYDLTPKQLAFVIFAGAFLADFSGANAPGADAAALARGGHDRVWRRRGLCAKGFETHVRLFVHQSSRLLFAWHFRAGQADRQ